MAKAVTGRIVEITIGTLVQGTILNMLGFHSPYEYGFLMTVTEELLCFIICFINERVWNRVNWGREVEDI